MHSVTYKCMMTNTSAIWQQDAHTYKFIDGQKESYKNKNKYKKNTYFFLNENVGEFSGVKKKAKKKKKAGEWTISRK